MYLPRQTVKKLALGFLVMGAVLSVGEIGQSADKLLSLKQIEAKYSTSKGLKADVTKILTLKMLDQTRQFSGTLELMRPGLFRLEFQTPERSLALTDGKTIWMVSYPSDPTIDTTTRVLRSKNQDRVQSQALLTLLLGRGSLLSEFKLVDQKKEGSLTRFFLSPKKKMEEVVRVNILADQKKGEIASIQYWDGLENQTELKLTNTIFNSKPDRTRFVFEVPKGAEVTDL